MAAPEGLTVHPGRSPSPPAVTAVCALCLAAPGRYTCPRCNAPYCSLACYRGSRHSACSELFYREAVLRVLREEEEEAGGDRRRRVEEMLVKLRQEEDGGDDEEEDGGGGLWDSLSRQEKEHFIGLLQSGHIGVLLPQWRPWWDNQPLQCQGDKIMELPETKTAPERYTRAPLPETKAVSERCLRAPLPETEAVSECCLRALQPETEAVSERCLRALLPETEAVSERCPKGPPPEAKAVPKRCPKGPPPEAKAVPKRCPRASPSETEAVTERCPGAPSSAYGQEGGTNMLCPTSSDSPPTNCPETIQDVASVYDQVLNPPETANGEKTASGDPSKLLCKKRANHGHCETLPPNDSSIDDLQTKDGDPSVDDGCVTSGVPALLACIPPLSSLTRSPSPLVRFTLVNVIYGYSFSLLRHNGDVSDDEMMLCFIGTLLSVSGALSTTTVYNSAAHAVKSGVRAASDPLLGGDEGAAVLAMEATVKILLGDGSTRYSLAALSHLCHLLGKIRKVVTEEKDAKKRAFIAKKKCLFLAAWVNENGDCLAVLSAEVMMEYEQHLKDLKEMAEISTGLQRVWGGKRPPAKKKLIQEVN